MPESAKRSQTASPFNRDSVRSKKIEFIRVVASDLFNKKGFEATTLDEVADRVGVSKPSIYYYYQNKSDLLLECYRRTLDICETLLEEAEQSEGSALDKFVHFTYQLVYLNCSRGAIAVVSEVDCLPAGERAEFADRSKAFTLALERLVQDGVDDGSIRIDLAPVTIRFAMGAANWIPRWYDEAGSLSPAELADTYVQFLKGGISGER